LIKRDVLDEVCEPYFVLPFHGRPHPQHERQLHGASVVGRGLEQITEAVLQPRAREVRIRGEHRRSSAVVTSEGLLLRALATREREHDDEEHQPGAASRWH